MKTRIQSWKALIKFTLYYFSVSGLLRTFFVPWRREKYNAESGFWGALEKLVFAIFAIVFGMVIRSITILVGLIFLLVVILLYPFFLIFPIKFNYESLSKNGSLGREWSYPVTYLLDQHGRDLRKNKDILVLDHDSALEQMQRVMSRKTQQNILVVGVQGIGKSTRLGHLARMMHRDLSVPALNGKRLVQLFPQEMSVQKIQKCIKEAIAAQNIVLVIENIERFNIIGVLEPYLDDNNFQMILTTDWSSYNETYKHNQNLMRVSEVVEMHPPDNDTTMLYLRDWTIGQGQSKRMNNDVLASVVLLSNKLMMNQAQPEKSIDILEELVSLDQSEISVSDVEVLLSQKTNVPLGALNRDEKDTLIHLEEVLTGHVIGQKKAIRAISSALKRGRVGVADSPKPIGSFLFLGPTGVGKTHTAKMLAAYYFGGERMMIRFDMSEFRELDSMNRFIERLGVQVEAAPFSLVFFDEIEKSHPDILNIFLQLLDEGEIHAQNGRTISFRNTMVICTSNAGASFMMANEHESQDYLINHIVAEGILRPEFINRFDATILYESLSRDEIKQITLIMLNKLNKHIMKQHRLEVLITDELVNALARKGHDPKFGVRPLARVIQDYIETEIADVLLLEPVPENLSLMIDPTTLSD